MNSNRWIVFAIVTLITFSISSTDWAQKRVNPCDYWEKHIVKIKKDIRTQDKLLSLYNSDESGDSFLGDFEQFSPAELRRIGFSDDEIEDYLKTKTVEKQTLKEIENVIDAAEEEMKREVVDEKRRLFKELLKASSELAMCNNYE